MTEIILEYQDGSKTEPFWITYGHFLEMFKSGMWAGKPLASVEITRKPGETKGPNRLRFV